MISASRTAAPPPRLRLSHVSDRYPGLQDPPLEVLRDISLDVASGEFITVIGGSGFGKTTLLRIIDRFIGPTAFEAVREKRHA